MDNEISIGLPSKFRVRKSNGIQFYDIPTHYFIYVYLHSVALTKTACLGCYVLVYCPPSPRLCVYVQTGLCHLTRVHPLVPKESDYSCVCAFGGEAKIEKR